VPPDDALLDDALLDELLEVAGLAADAAVELIHTNRPAEFAVDRKTTPTDMVTEMDTASEALIRSVILGRRPGDVIVGEEGGEVGGGGPSDAQQVRWLVDPIDGTTNYVYDHPGYNVSIAATLGGRTVAAVVADPTHARTYRAALGRGAWCNERRLHLGDAAPLDRALVATGFAYDPARRARQGAVLAGLIARIRDVRRMGAAALDLCSVAAGRVDAYYEAGLGPWDLAAGALVAEEAGARTGTLDGGPLRPESVLVAHPDRFEELRDLLVELGADRV
jgi:myo-inositol-1(or 4)-monophosphatase